MTNGRFLVPVPLIAESSNNEHDENKTRIKNVKRILTFMVTYWFKSVTVIRDK